MSLKCGISEGYEATQKWRQRWEYYWLLGLGRQDMFRILSSSLVLSSMLFFGFWLISALDLWLFINNNWWVYPYWWCNPYGLCGKKGVLFKKRLHITSIWFSFVQRRGSETFYTMHHSDLGLLPPSLSAGPGIQMALSCLV